MSEVLRDQERLGRALDRARVSEDRVLAAQVRDEGAQVVSLLCGVLRMSHMHAPENEAFNKPMRDLTGVLGRLVELLGPVHLAMVEDQVYVNEIRVHTEERAEGTRELAAELRRHAVGGITFRDALPEAKLRALVGGFALKPASVQPRATLRAALKARGLDEVELSGLYRYRHTGEDTTSTRTAAQLAARAATLSDESFQNLGAHRLPNPLPVRRAVAEMLAREDGLDTVPEVTGSGSVASASVGAHSMRVAQLALLIGEAAGLPEGVLQDLGVAALFHDVGYAAREGKLPGQPGHPPPFSRHGSAGARLLLRQRGFHEAKVRRVRSVLAHHRDYGARPRPSLLARILRIAEDYDTATHRGGSLLPDEALARMASGAGSRYDPVLLQAFVNTLGRWPPGTLLTLEDGRQARVIAPARTRERFERPLVRVERLADGSPPARPEVIDLARVALRVRGSEPSPAAPAEAGPDLDDFVLVEPAEAAPARTSGEVRGGALALILSRIHLERLSGRLTLRGPQQERTLFFADGRGTGASSSAPSESVTDTLTRLGLPAAAAPAGAGPVADLGRALQGGGLGEADCHRALAAHVRTVLSPAFGWDMGEYELEPAPAGGSAPQLHPEIGDIVLEAVRSITDPDAVRQELGDLDRVLAKTENARLAAQSIRFDQAERLVRSVVDGRLTAREVLGVGGLPAPRAQRALLALIRAGSVLVRAPG